MTLWVLLLLLDLVKVSGVGVSIGCLLCASIPLQTTCRPLISNCPAGPCLDCTNALQTGLVLPSCQSDPTACAFLECAFVQCPLSCPQTFCLNPGGNSTTSSTSSSSSSTAVANSTATTSPAYSTCNPAGGVLCAPSDRLCDASNPNDTFPLCNFCNSYVPTWREGPNGCLNFGICTVQDAAPLAAQAGFSVPPNTLLPICTCQPPYIPPQCRITVFEYFNAWPVYNARWYFFGVCCIVIIISSCFMAQHIILDKRQSNKIQQGTAFHIFGLSLLIAGAITFAFFIALNFQGTYYGGYNGNFGWIYTSYLWLNLASAFALMEGALIAGQWFNVFLVFVALSRGKVQSPIPLLPYIFAVTVGVITITYAFVAAWASTFTTIWRYVQIELVIIAGAEALLVLITATYANLVYKRHSIKMLALGRSYASQGRKLLVQAVITCSCIAAAAIVSLIVFLIPESTYATLGGNAYIVSFYIPLLVQVGVWASILLFHSRAEWKSSLLNTKKVESTSETSTSRKSELSHNPYESTTATEPAESESKDWNQDFIEL